jgi:hypothetical protein
LVVEPKDEDSRLNFFCGDQSKAAGQPPEFYVRIGCNSGQSVVRCGVAWMIEAGKPVVEETAGGGVRDEANFVAEARQANEDSSVNGADMVARTGRYWSVGGIPKNDSVNLVWIIFVVVRGSRRGRRGAGGTGATG